MKLVASSEMPLNFTNDLTKIQANEACGGFDQYNSNF